MGPRCPRGEIYLPGNPARAGLGERGRHSRWRDDPRTKLPIGFLKGPRSRLDLPATHRAANLHEPLNPSSVLVYLLRYATESRLTDPGLREAFVLDFLTAAAASLCLLQITVPHQIDRWGRTGAIVYACLNFFWAPAYGHQDPVWFLNEPFFRFWEMLDPLGTDLDHGLTRELFHELKECYYSILGCSGLDVDTLMSVANAGLCKHPWVEWC